MARVVAEMPEVHRPWDEWLDGQVWALRMGDEFANVDTCRSAAAQAAKVRGLKVITRKVIEDDGTYVYIQAYEEES